MLATFVQEPLAQIGIMYDEGYKQVRQSLFILCLTAFAVIDLFRLLHPAKIDRACVIFNLCLSACFAIGFDVITLCDSHLLHNLIFIRLQR